MENLRRVSGGGLEENVLAILDSGSRDSRDLDDDRLSFLEAVRAAYLSSASLSPPSCKIFLRVFQILRESTSLEVFMSSFRLLTDLEKQYPRVYLVSSDTHGSEDSSGVLGLVQEAWLPFASGAEVDFGEEKLFDLQSFSALLECIAQEISKINIKTSAKHMGDMLVLQYLVNVLELDFLPRHAAYKGTFNWVFLRESVLNNLLGSRKTSFKTLVRDCLSILYQLSHSRGFNLHEPKNADKISMRVVVESTPEMKFLFTELHKGTCTSVQKLFVLIMDLDLMKKESELRGLTSRVDGVRTPLLDIILDELCYNRENIYLFLEVFYESQWKLEIILQYFSKYSIKPSVCTRRSSASSDDATFEGVLRLFSTTSSAKNISKKLTPEVAQFLLSHAFQSYLSVNQDSKNVLSSTSPNDRTALRQICNDVVLAFQNIQKTNADLEIGDFEKGAIFTAATISSN